MVEAMFVGAFAMSIVVAVTGGLLAHLSYSHR